MKFTTLNVLKLKAPEGKNDVTIWDDGLPGFGIRFRNQGAGVYTIQYSIDGREAKMSLGKVAQVTLEAAHIEAKKHFANIAQKKDPHAERAKTATPPTEKFSDRIDAFLAELGEGKPGRKPRTPGYIDAIKRSLKDRCADFADLGLSEITRRSVVDMLDEMEEERGWRAAGVTQAHLSSYYSYCMRKGYEGFNPVHGTERRNSTQRTRVHTVEELKLIWEATEEETFFNRLVRLIMLTGMRKTIFGSLRRDEVNTSLRLIEVGAEVGKSKNGEEFLLPMSTQVEAMISKRLKWTNGDFLFTDGGTKLGFTNWQRQKGLLDARVTKINGGKEIPHWVLHDFRRTFMSLGQDCCKIPQHIADVCIYHVGEAKKGLNGVYNKATYIDEKREALQKWADFIHQLVGEAEMAEAA